MTDTIKDTGAPERTATAEELLAESAKLERAASGQYTATLHAIIVRASYSTCGECWAEPTEPCGDARGDLDALHLARFARARRRGLLTEAELARVLELAGDVFTEATLIRDVR